MIQTLIGCAMIFVINSSISKFCDNILIGLSIKVVVSVLAYGCLLVILRNELAISILKKLRRKKMQ